MTLTLLMTCSHIQRIMKLKYDLDLDPMTWILQLDLDTSSFYVKGFKSYSLNRQKHRQIDRHTDTQTEIQTDRQTHRHTDRQKHRQTDTTENITYQHTRVVKMKPMFSFHFISFWTYWSTHFLKRFYSYSIVHLR